MLAFIIICTSQWCAIQFFRSLSGPRFNALERWEEYLYKQVDERVKVSNPTFAPMVPPTITRLSNLQAIDTSKPFLLRGLGDPFDSEDFFKDRKIASIVIEYFTDARRVNTVPDAVGKVADVVAAIRSGAPQKFGSQKPVHEAPTKTIDLLLRSHSYLRHIFPFRFTHIWANVGARGTLLSKFVNLIVTAPTFMARGEERGDDSDGLSTTSRTDLHCEPINNLVFQTEGVKTWTLVDPSHSLAVRRALHAAAADRGAARPRP